MKDGNSEAIERARELILQQCGRSPRVLDSRIPNLNRMILDKKELFSTSYRPRMKQIIEKELGKDCVPYLWLEETVQSPAYVSHAARGQTGN